MQERQIIGYKPDGTPIYGPPTSAPNANLQGLLSPQSRATVRPGPQANVAALQPPAPVEAPEATDGLMAMIQEALGKIQQVGQAYLDFEVDKASRLMGAMGQGARAVGAFAGDVARDVQGMTLPKAANALEQLSAGITGSDAQTFPGEADSPLGKLAWGAGLGLGMLDPGPAGEARALSSLGTKVLSEAEQAAAERAGKVSAAVFGAPFKFKGVDDLLTPKEREAFAKVRDAGFTVASLPKAAKPGAIAKSILENGGVTVHPSGRVLGYGVPGPTMAGMFPNDSGRTFVIEASKFQPRHVANFLVKNRDVFAKDELAHIGGWADTGEDGIQRIYLDVSKPFPSVREAAKFAELQNPGMVRNKPTGVMRQEDGTWPQAQKAVWHPGEAVDPKVGNLYEFVTGPQVQSRMDEMAQVGKREMEKSGSTNWWSLLEGPLERIYGRENLEKVAGFLASTSPQNPPRPNARMATELMRRSIKGEDIAQPGWRAPSTAMGEGFSPKPGAAMPGANTWTNNATKVNEGRASEIQSDKVNDMFHALMGKDVGVYDRHWAKLMENPQEGVFTDVSPNKIAGSMGTGQISPYAVIENAVRDAAKRNGVPLSDYSAWVWEGIRTTIANTGELYGQPHRASAIPTGRNGFNEIFTQLIQEKAKHLGVSVGELEQRLRSGDAELLTAILATATGGAAASRPRDDGQTRPGGGA